RNAPVLIFSDLIAGCDVSRERSGGVRKIKATATVTNVPAAIRHGKAMVGSHSQCQCWKGGPLGCAAIQARKSGSEGCSRFQRSLCRPLRNATATNPHAIATRLQFSLPRVLVSIPTRKTPRSEPYV